MYAYLGHASKIFPLLKLDKNPGFAARFLCEQHFWSPCLDTHELSLMLNLGGFMFIRAACDNNDY